MQGFIPCSTERSDKALDAFDQELRDPRTVRTGCVPNSRKPEGVFSQARLSLQSEPQMDSTANASSNSTPKSTRELIDEDHLGARWRTCPFTARRNSGSRSKTP